jgi:radical SAM/Cys-rich protein
MIKSLKARESELASANVQVGVIERSGETLPTFEEKLETIGLWPLKPTSLEILQINLGKMCNQTCEHCHVDAGPDRKEIMTRSVMEECLKVAAHPSVKTVDLTGGAPEMNPDFLWFLEELSKLDLEIIVRSNLTILNANKKYFVFPELFKKYGVTVISSMPCYTADNVDKQRGDGVFDSSIKALQTLNELGYGKEGSGMNLHLVYNPGGASLPPDQMSLEADYKRELKKHFNIEFNALYTITNLPISRFLDDLLKKGKYEFYMEKLVEAFNPSAAMGVMCRNTISVGWDGKLYDCDFNQMLEMPIALKDQKHISDLDLATISDREIMVNQHCFGCTAGSGSSCQGSLV